jgi:hypothetical protein
MDRVKVRQESYRLRSTYTYQNVGGQLSERGLPVSQGYGLAREGSKASHRSEYGKPDAVKVACPVWNGGKAERPYLSLQEEKGTSRQSYETDRTCFNELKASRRVFAIAHETCC